MIWVELASGWGNYFRMRCHFTKHNVVLGNLFQFTQDLETCSSLAHFLIWNQAKFSFVHIWTNFSWALLVSLLHSAISTLVTCLELEDAEVFGFGRCKTVDGKQFGQNQINHRALLVWIFTLNHSAKHGASWHQLERVCNDLWSINQSAVTICHQILATSVNLNLMGDFSRAGTIRLCY